MKRLGFQIKLSLIFIFLLVGVLFVTTYFIYQSAITQQSEELRNKLLSQVRLASMLIDTEKLVQIKPELASQNTLIYKEIKQILDRIRNSDKIIDSVYTMIKSDKENIWIFLVDSGDKRGMSAFCGELYDVSKIPEMQMAFSLPSADKKFNADKWGVFVSGYAPLHNRLGEAKAIVGIDIKAESIRNMQLILAKKIVWVLVLGVLFSLFLGWFVAKNITNPIKKLIQGVRSVGRGNFRGRVVVNTQDELEELGDAFNKMTNLLQEAEVKLQRYYLDTIKSLARALEAKDPYTSGHSERVMRYAVSIAKRLGLSDLDIDLLVEICILHDIGKIGVPERILSKVSPLSEDEWQIIKMHPKIGEDILRHVEFLEQGLTVIRHHHERPDGMGYPDGLTGIEIPILASIVAVADAYDAMTTDRPYRKALTKEEAIKALNDNKDKQFHSKVVDEFVEYLKKK